MSSLVILGRQPELGLAELESLFGNDAVRPVLATANASSPSNHSNSTHLIHAAELSVEASDIPFSRLGGAIKAAKVLTILDTQDWRKIEGHFIKTVAEHASYLPEGKLTVGLSVYGNIRAREEDITRTALKIKKLVKATGRPVRVVPNKQAELSTAQVIHNGLTCPNGWELLVVADSDRTIIALTTAIQDIEAYTARDQVRPQRDAKVGMLPPKLAQIIVNLATGPVAATAPATPIVLDPFCGTGVVLQEALLMGFGVYGTDLEPRMVSYTKSNLQWLHDDYRFSRNRDKPAAEHTIEQGDAGDHQWTAPFTTVAAETYLGRPFSAEPVADILVQVMHDVNNIHRRFLKNLAAQTAPGFRLCIAVPAWFTKHGVRRLSLLDDLKKIGYTRVRFQSSANGSLIYHREGQFVGRELVVLVRS